VLVTLVPLGLLGGALIAPVISSLAVQPAAAAANAVVPDSAFGNFTPVQFPANDDNSTALIPFGFNINFYGTEYSGAYVNNNGNITFANPLHTYTPFGLGDTGGIPIIAPFFADVYTEVGPTVEYGTGTLDGHNVFVVNWPGVACFDESTPAVTDNFQVILIDRPDAGTGPLGDDFTIEFNYDSIQWDAGMASGGNSACTGAPAGESAAVGFSNGTTTAGDSYELPGSQTTGAFLDSNVTTGLIYNDLNSDVPGRYVFGVTGGQPEEGGPVLPPPPAAVEGYYVPVVPTRITDTRPDSGLPNAGSPIAADSTLNVQVTGVAAVPADASAAVLDVTAVDPTASGYLTVFPEGIARPDVSNVNFSPGADVSNLVTVPLGASGGVTIYNYAGDTNVVVDLEGYYTSGPSTDGSGLYNAVSPARVLGTLTSGTAIGPNTSQAVTVTGTGAAGIPANATAVVLNVTAAGATAPSFLTVYPAGTAMPVASDLNFGEQASNEAVANRVTVGVGSLGQIEVYNHTGTVNVDVDVDGYYTGVGGNGSYFVPTVPVRLVDTRASDSGTPIGPNSSEVFSLVNFNAVPPFATSVAANFTMIPGDAPGYLTVYPTSDTTAPVASDINWTANETPADANFTIADTAGTGSVDVYNSQGATINLLIDAFGYFTTAWPVPPL
jgi:hypothetical protein